MRDAALEQFRRICLSLPGATEGRHHESVAFRVGRKMFATWNEEHGPRIVLQLESAHAAALLKNDPRFAPYPRLKDVVTLDATRVTDWDDVEALVRESNALATAPARSGSRSKRR